MREGSLLNHIYKANPNLPGFVTIPPGDDMAGLRLGDQEILVTVDQLADGVHFRLADTPLELIGRKAMTRNLSDVAAMAALPLAAVVAGALPRTFTEIQANTLFDAMRQTSKKYNCPLVGGDITIYDAPLMLTVTVLATPSGVQPVRRNGAKVGDVIAVTGKLGGAWSKESGRGDHLTFEPRIQLARKLATTPGVKLHSMIDLSDGLASDLKHICEQSGVGAELDADEIPLRQGVALQSALCDGEDYELLFTLTEEAAKNLPREIDSVSITKIGRVIAGDSIVLIKDNRREPFLATGWEHRTQ